MDDLLVPTLLVAFGGAGLVVLRGGRPALAALVVQWLGLLWAGATLSAVGQERVLGISAESLTEMITAVVCAVVLGVTLVAVQREEAGLRVQRGTSAPPTSPLNDYLLPVAVVLLGGVAGLGFASLFPLGDPSISLVFYWAVMAGVLALILDGAREPVKLAAGLLTILNAVALLVYALSVTTPGAALLGLLSATRIGLAVLLAYGWAMLLALFGELSLEPLFDVRATPQRMELMVVEQTPPPADEESSETSQSVAEDAAPVEQEVAPGEPDLVEQIDEANE